MKYQLAELIDINKIQALFENFSEATGIVTAILDLEGKVLVATGWQDLCTKFHRVHPETSQRCTTSDTVLAGQLGKGEPYNVYKCMNGLVDVAVPIIIDGDHWGNFFTGQIFFEPPDVEFFRRQAMTYGFDESAYLKALSKIPVFSDEQVRHTMEFLTELTALVGKMGLVQKRQLEINEELEQRVMDRTQKLSYTLENLQTTQTQLIESEKMASLGRLVAGFAHELNTPIGVAIGSASALQREAQKLHQLMAQEEVDVDELLAAVTSIEKGFTLTLSNLERAANLVTRFKRTAVDQTSGEVRTFHVLDVIKDTINTLHNQFKPTQIEIQVTCPSELKVKSLPGALERILTNLLMNSLIHGFEEGQRAGQINLLVQLQETQLHLEYSDNGKGIASENLAKIFEPFFTTHRAHGGSGLGMYICYNLVTTQLQGLITVDSVLGQGVVFRIDYPVLVA